MGCRHFRYCLRQLAELVEPEDADHGSKTVRLGTVPGACPMPCPISRPSLWRVIAVPPVRVRPA